MKKLLGAAAVAAAITLAAAPSASADASTYYRALDDQGLITWDYPLLLAQGNYVCDLLWNDINPVSWLMYTVGYDAPTASSIIAAARVGLCPGNAVTQYPPQLQYAL